MTHPNPGIVTELLNEAGRGNRDAYEKLAQLAYEEVLKLARARMAKEPQIRNRKSPESLVHEAWMRIFRERPTKDDWVCRQQFYGYVRRAMWRVCVEWARKNANRAKVEPFSDWMVELQQEPEDIVALDDALEKLALQSPLAARAAQVVRLRFVEGRSVEETAAILGVGKRTVVDDWRIAKASLHRQLKRGDTTVGAGTT